MRKTILLITVLAITSCSTLFLVEDPPSSFLEGKLLSVLIDQSLNPIQTENDSLSLCFKAEDKNYFYTINAELTKKGERYFFSGIVNYYLINEPEKIICINSFSLEIIQEEDCWIPRKIKLN